MGRARGGLLRDDLRAALVLSLRAGELKRAYVEGLRDALSALLEASDG